MGKSAPSPPPAPNPAAIASAQGTANVDTAKAQAALNNVNQITPYGTSTFTSQPSASDPSIPQYTQNIQLNPTAQNTLTQQQQLANTLAGYGTQIAGSSGGAITKPLDFNGLPATPTSLNLSGASPIPQPGNFQNEADQAAQGAFKSQMGLLEPGMDQQTHSLESDMRNAGIPQNSEAWNRAETQLAAQQGMTTNALAGQSVGLGQAEQQALTQEALAGRGQAAAEAGTNAQLQSAARGQGITEQQLSQTQPINELAALLQGAPAIGSPSVMSPAQTGISPTDVTGAFGLQQAGLNNAYNARVNAASSGNQAGAGLLGSAALAAALL